MTNEEFQQAMLAQMSTLTKQMASLDDKVTSIDERVTSLDDKVTSIDERVTSLDRKVDILGMNLRSEIKNAADDMKAYADSRATEIKTYIENGVGKSVQILSETYIPMAAKMDVVRKDVDGLREDMQVVKAVVTSHSAELKKAK